MEDKELIGLLKSEPQRGLEQTVRKYNAYVYKIARTRLGSVCAKEDIEEAVSDIFAAFYFSGRKTGFEMDSVIAFLSVIARRHCCNVFLRQSGKADDLPLDELENILPDRPDEDMSAVTNAVDSLGEPDRSIFIRKYFLGQKNKDIAKELHMKTNTVSKRISRGLLKLKEILEEGL